MSARYCSCNFCVRPIRCRPSIKEASFFKGLGKGRQLAGGGNEIRRPTNEGGVKHFGRPTKGGEMILASREGRQTILDLVKF